jgi:hypothetical protein
LIDQAKARKQKHQGYLVWQSINSLHFLASPRLPPFLAGRDDKIAKKTKTIKNENIKEVPIYAVIL